MNIIIEHNLRNKMKARFMEEDGQRLLIESLKQQYIIESNLDLAKEFASRGNIIDFAAGDTIIQQNSTDNILWFIISGTVDVFVNERRVASRDANECLGEMAIIDHSNSRSATIKAKTEVVAFKVSENDFYEVSKQYPLIWKAIARVTCARLRQRSAFHSKPNPEPILFIGSSTEALPLAQEIQLGLKHENIEVRIWTNGIFGAGGIPFDELRKQVYEADFAAFLFTMDDVTVCRTEKFNTPRDNIIFELGLFMAELDRNRAFIIKNKSDDIKIPTDLLGITTLEYINKASGNISSSMGTVYTELCKAIKKLGVK